LYPQILTEVFATCGFDLRNEVDLIRVDPMYDLVFEGEGTLHATADQAAMAREIARFSAADAEALPRYMADNRAIKTTGWAARQRD
jgi:phytoene desaturase